TICTERRFGRRAQGVAAEPRQFLAIRPNAAAGRLDPPQGDPAQGVLAAAGPADEAGRRAAAQRLSSVHHSAGKVRLRISRRPGIRPSRCKGRSYRSEQPMKGRRRGTDLEEALLEATWMELTERGGGLTMEGVAARAGT